MPDEIPAVVLLGDIYKRLRTGAPLTDDQARALTAACSPVQQCSALAGLALRGTLSAAELQTAQALASTHPRVAALLQRRDLLHDPAAFSGAEKDAWGESFDALLAGRAIGASSIRRLVADIVSRPENLTEAAAFLMAVCVKGMGDADVNSLTSAMADSGPRFDYRSEPSLDGARLVRRYPTGALSEKIAIILPPLLMSARPLANVCSPFLVARSLGYTGGTWDKLRAIEGFQFPEPGPETLVTLKRCGVAMTVTKGAANPADRILYQLRSVTGTVESHPLILSSIASKQLSFPVHRLLMDVRYGEGAFLEHKDEAQALGAVLERVLSREGVPTFFSLTDTEQPTGSAVGNALEVAEAVAVMGGAFHPMWDDRALQHQRLLAVDFFAKVMGAEFPERSVRDWAAFATRQFRDGVVLQRFHEMLVAHHVDPMLATNLLSDPFRTLGISTKPIHIAAEVGGTLRSLDQRRMGEIINRALGGGGNDIDGAFTPKAGLIINPRLGDPVARGDVLCSLFAEPAHHVVSDELRRCFAIV